MDDRGVVFEYNLPCSWYTAGISPALQDCSMTAVVLSLDYPSPCCSSCHCVSDMGSMIQKSLEHLRISGVIDTFSQDGKPQTGLPQCSKHLAFVEANDEIYYGSTE